MLILSHELKTKDDDCDVDDDDDCDVNDDDCGDSDDDDDNERESQVEFQNHQIIIFNICCKPCRTKSYKSLLSKIERRQRR